MQEWLLPLVEKIGTLEREIGQEQVRRQVAEQGLAATAMQVEELRRRAEGAEAESARLAALVTEQRHTLGQPQPREDSPETPEEQSPLRKRQRPWYRRIWSR